MVVNPEISNITNQNLYSSDTDNPYEHPVGIEGTPFTFLDLDDPSLLTGMNREIDLSIFSQLKESDIREIYAQLDHDEELEKISFSKVTLTQEETSENSNRSENSNKEIYYIKIEGVNFLDSEIEKAYFIEIAPRFLIQSILTSNAQNGEELLLQVREDNHDDNNLAINWGDPNNQMLRFTQDILYQYDQTEDWMKYQTLDNPSDNIIRPNFLRDLFTLWGNDSRIDNLLNNYYSTISLNPLLKQSLDENNKYPKFFNSLKSKLNTMGDITDPLGSSWHEPTRQAAGAEESHGWTQPSPTTESIAPTRTPTPYRPTPTP
jgi:hypothetical protein